MRRTWRVNGQTHWLWCFTNHETTFYQIDRSQGSPALAKFFQSKFSGTLVTDFWSAYEQVCAGDKQKCWADQLRELDAPKKPAPEELSDDWERFGRRVKRLFKDAVKLASQRDELEESAYELAISRLERRVGELAQEEWKSADARRLAKRLDKYGHELFTFLWYDDVDPTNNHAEREVRPAVQMRKNSYQNASQKSDLTQAVLMTIFRTLRRRGHNPLTTLTEAVTHYAATGQLPDLPAVNPSDK